MRKAADKVQTGGAPRPEWWRNPWLGAAVLALLVCAVYWPVFNGRLLGDFDDNPQANNPLALAADGWWRIWVAPPSNQSPDYFPLTTFVFWVLHRFWEGQSFAAACHTVNIALHFVNVLLVWRVLKALRIPVPWLAAAVFAVHPANVPSVAWVAEMKNTLAMPFFLVAVAAYLRFEDAPAGRRGRWYAVALACFVLGCLAKSTLVVTAPVLLLLAWWRRNRITWTDVTRSLPFWLGGFGFGLLTMLYQYRPNGGVKCEFLAFLPRGLYMVGHNVWFYVAHDLLPFWNCTIYAAPWSPADWPAGRQPTCAEYLPTALASAAFLALAFLTWRRKAAAWTRGLFLGCAYFLVAMALVLGVMPTLYLQFSPVTDHWQYMALPALAALPVCGGAVLLRRLAPSARWRPAFGAVLAAAWLAALAGFARPYAAAYHDSGTLWLDVLRKNPNAWIAWNNYGNWLFDETKSDEQALPYFERAFTLNPTYRDALYNAGTSYYALKRHAEAYEACRRSNETRPTPQAWTQMGMARRAQGRNAEALQCFSSAVTLDRNFLPAWLQAVPAQYDEGMYAAAAANAGGLVQCGLPLEVAKEVVRTLAWIRAACPDASLRDPEQAALLAEALLKLPSPADRALAYDVLGAARAAAGRYGDAVLAARRALEAASQAADLDVRMRGKIGGRLRLYEAGTPYVGKAFE